jgi:hypothetical protein
MRRAAALAALAALLAAPVALAHGIGASQGYVSTLTALAPPTLDLYVKILQGDDRLSVSNTSRKELVVFGYENEPYLRITPRGVYRNGRSPATYLNDDRFGNVELPADADPKAAPRWEKVSDETSYTWHDHRIHWMNTIPPPAIRYQPNVRHHFFDWTVPAELGGKPLAIRGSLDYIPPKKDSFNFLFVLPPVLALILAAGAWLALRRRSATAG